MFKRFLAILTAFLLVGAIFSPIVSAQSGGATGLKIDAPATAVVGEAFDVTVTAVDKDGNTATGYNGSIVFGTDWIGDVVPMPARSIPYTAEDAGVKKFSKGVTFKKAGKQKLFVYDLNSSLEWEVTITVSEGAATTTSTNEDLQILTPANDSKITGNTVTVSGKTRKNSKISLSLNGQDAGTVVSDNDGLFTKEIQNISQENNILKANLLDASNAVIASSSDIRFSKSTDSSSIYGVSILPATTVESSTGITINIDAVKGLSEVTAMLDGTLLKATEASDGKYVITTTAPQKAGAYPISVTAKTITNQVTAKENIATLTVEEKKPVATATGTLTPAFKNVKAETKDQKITFSFGVENPPTALSNFKITYGTGSSVDTFAAEKILKDGVYTWYIDHLQPGDYTFVLHGQTASGSLIEGLSSEPIPATIGVAMCTISNVGKITVTTDSSKSVLSWDAVPGATGYNVYRIDQSGKYNLVQKVDSPTYTLFLSRGAITYDNFAVKALCGANTESQDYSEASKVQTWPGAIAFVVVVSGIFAGFVLYRRRA